jgi:hypothetical protein
MDPTRIVLAGCWTALMLVYLLGDVLRLFAGDSVPGELDGRPAAGWMWTVAALIMLLPIAMLVASLLVPVAPLRWTTIVVTVGLALFNIVALPYKGFYDNLLIAVSFLINALIAWQAWTWEAPAG